jgi:hypothetical protein
VIRVEGEFRDRAPAAERAVAEIDADGVRIYPAAHLAYPVDFVLASSARVELVDVAPSAGTKMLTRNHADESTWILVPSALGDAAFRPSNPGAIDGLPVSVNRSTTTALPVRQDVGVQLLPPAIAAVLLWLGNWSLDLLGVDLSPPVEMVGIVVVLALVLLPSRSAIRWWSRRRRLRSQPTPRQRT